MRETITIKKLFFVWDFDKEENWLNEMALNGWVLCGVGFCKYTFEKCEPGEYIVRLGFAENTDEFTGLVKDMGGEYIGKFMRWMYFRNRTEYGNFELNPDADSQITMLNSIGRMLKIIGFANLTIGIANSMNIAAPMGIINLLCAMLLFYALGRTEGRIDELKKIREYYE